MNYSGVAPINSTNDVQTVGNLIDKKRLRAVPHATQSIEAKLNRG